MRKKKDLNLIVWVIRIDMKDKILCLRIFLVCVGIRWRYLGGNNIVLIVFTL